jgi:NADH dehydrogenase [ubiquinone] 1 alpha subcomplex assembly factor 7
MNPSNPVFGPRGDFTTSPEISQVFGEVIVLRTVMQSKE